MPGVSVTWSLSQGQGTLIGKIETTDQNGFATSEFVSTFLQPGTSFQAATVAASSSLGTVNFVITTNGGGFVSVPLVELIQPPSGARNFSGRAGSTISNAVAVRVVAQRGIQTGQGVPNVAMRIVNADEPTSPPVASCSAPLGTVLTDATGVARCDLTLGSVAGVTRIAAHVGEFQYTPTMNLEITPGAACTFGLSPSVQSIAAGGGSGSFSVTAPAGCAWTATSNASWISLTSGITGTGNGSVAYTASANAGAARSGTLTVGGQAFTVSQPAATLGPALLGISTGAALQGGKVGTPYSAALQATGGTPPYTWTFTGSVPPGTTLNPASGVLSGTPAIAGTYGFTATAKDAAGASASRAFTLTVSPANTGGGAPGSLTIVNSTLPNGAPGQAYQQALTSSGGCSNPFGPTPQFALASGSLPPGLSVGLIGSSAYGISGTPTTNGVYNFVLRVTDSCQNSATGSFSITVGSGGGTGAAALAVTPGSLTFSATQSSTTSPEPKQIRVTSASATPFTASASVNWLSVTSGGTTPATVAVSVVNHSTLAAGNHQGVITISPQSGGAAVTVQVILNVASAVSLGIEPATINFTVNGAGTFNRELVVTNPAGLQFSAVASTTAGGNWLSVTPQGGSATTTLSIGVNTNGLQPQSYLGFVTITAAGGSPQQIPVSLDVIASLTASLTELRFASDRGTVPAGQTITIGSSGDPLNFRVSVRGPFTVTPSSGVTPAALSVAANPQGLAAGTYAGGITLTVDTQTQAAAPVTIPVTITVTQSGPAVTAVTNAASFLAGPIAPGEFVTIFGSEIGPGTLAISEPTAAGFVPDTVAQTRVLFDGIPAPVIYSSSSQVTAIVPYGMTGRATARVEVEYAGVRSGAVDVPVSEAAPGIFTVDANGQGAILNQDMSANSMTNGAEPGSIVSIYATGEGATEPVGLDGQITVDTLAKPSLPVKVLINGEETEVLYSGSAPGMPAGVIQVNARVPASAPRGAFVDVRLHVGSAESQPGVKLATKP